MTTLPRVELPAYAPSSVAMDVHAEKEAPPNRQRCEHGTSSQTPHIDAHLQKPNARSVLLALSAAFAAAAEEDRCLKCAVGSVVPDLKLCMQDMKMAKKNGSFTKEDKKALKAEMKWLLGGLKDVRKSWKTEA